MLPLRRSEDRELLERALRLLSQRAYSRAELRLKLERLGYGQEAISRAILKLEEYGYLDDKRFAEEYASAKLRLKGMGKLRLRRELVSKGVGEEAIEEGIRRAFEGRSEEEVAMEVAQRRLAAYSGLDASTLKRRLYAFLLRRGFTHDVALRVILRLTGE